MGRMAIATLIAAAVASGCGDEQAGAEKVTTNFLSALEMNDGGVACTALSQSAREALERDEQAPCPEALRSLRLSAGEVTRTQIHVTQARVSLSNGQSLFLGRTSSGWRVDAAGCRPAAKGEPFECELES